MKTETVVFTNGCFDIFHAGHADFLKRCRALGTLLIVGLNSDASVRRLKGKDRPICTQDQRKAVLMACRYVGSVVIFEQDDPCELIRELTPDIIVKGPGYSVDNMPEAEVVKEWGGEVVILDGPDISTSSIIKKIRESGDAID